MLVVRPALKRQCVFSGNQVAGGPELKDAAGSLDALPLRQLAIEGAVGLEGVSKTQHPVNPLNSGAKEFSFNLFGEVLVKVVFQILRREQQAAIGSCAGL